MYQGAICVYRVDVELFFHACRQLERLFCDLQTYWPNGHQKGNVYVQCQQIFYKVSKSVHKVPKRSGRDITINDVAT